MLQQTKIRLVSAVKERATLVKVSVVIETINALHYGEHHLFKSLDSIRSQRNDLEIIIVNVGISAAALRKISRQFGDSVRIVDAFGASYFQAKNIGYKLASGSIVAFADSDCIPSKEWLSEITEPFAKGAQAVAGRSLYDGGFMAKVGSIADFGYFPDDKSDYTKPFASNNVAFRKGLDYVFEKSYWRTGGDVTMAEDMYADRIPIYFKPSAKIRHQFPYRIRDFFNKRLQQGFHFIEARKIDSRLGGGYFLRARAAAPLIYYFGRLASDLEAIRIHRQELKVKWWEAPFLLLFLIVYRLIDFISMMLTLAAPAALRLKFETEKYVD